MYYFIPLLCNVLFLESFPLDMVLHFHVCILRYDLFSTAETLTWINEPSAGDGVTGELLCNFKLDLYWKYMKFCENSPVAAQLNSHRIRSSYLDVHFTPSVSQTSSNVSFMCISPEAIDSLSIIFNVSCLNWLLGLLQKG